jgi:beta-aspartyl-dipeptidase (metallo-type)
MNTKKTFFTLLKNAHVIAPEDLGVKDILVAGEKIAMIGEGLSLPAIYDCEVVDCSELVYKTCISRNNQTSF